MSLFVVDPLFAINQLTLLAAVGFCGGLYLFVHGFHLLTRKRLLLNTPISKIRSVSMGLAEVTGLASGPYTIPAPVTGKACYLYQTTIWRQRENSKNQEWKKVAEETLHVPFFLDDSTGKLLVDPAGAELDLHRDFCEKYDQTRVSRVPASATSFLARHGVTPEGDHFRIEEWTIPPQSPLFIVGTVAENPGIEVLPSPAERKTNPTRVSLQRPVPATPQEVVRLSPTASPSTARDMTQQSKIAAALTQAGISSPAAWEAAGVPSWRPADGENPRVQEISVNAENTMSQAEASFDLTPPVVLMKGENNPAFLISWRSQSKLVGSLGRKSAIMIWGGGALTLLALYVVLQQFGLL